MSSPDKDTIYIDIDDEITGIIDKVRGSNSQVVALVLPKRATVFQSIVNMKLLKRASETAKKNIVLITSEAGLLPLAGAAGVHVAKTLTSKPEIPLGPDAEPEIEDVAEETPEDPDAEVTTDTAGDKPIGDLAGIPPKDGVETLQLEDDVMAPEATPDDPLVKDNVPKGKKDKKFSIPDFNRFRLWMILGGLGLILFIFLLYICLGVLPKATIAIDTDAVGVNVNTNLKLSTTAKTIGTSDGTIPAKLVQQQKTYTQQGTTSGQKNKGEKAKGAVTLTNCSGGDATIASGTGVSSGGNTYIVQTTVTVPDSNYKITGECKKDGHADVNVVAQSGGASYNLSSGAAFTVAGRSSVTGVGQTISGGTDNIVKVVSQADIDSAKGKINTNDPSIKDALKKQLEDDNYFAILATFSAGTPSVTASPNVGDESSTVTVTANVTYNMFGVREDDLKALVDEDIKGQIDTSKQGILSEGLDKATFNVNAQTDKDAQLAMSTTATVGPDLDIGAIKRDAAGKKSGAVKDQLQTNPDVKSVSVKLSPFWVSSVPKKQSKITVTIEKPKTTAGKATTNGQ